MSLPLEPIVDSAEANRLEALRLAGLLDTPAEEVFDRFTLLAKRLVGVPVVLISLVDENRQFFKSQCGLPEPWASERETPLSHSFCQYVTRDREPLIVSDARLDSILKDNLAVEDLGVVAYAGVPLRTFQGEVIGSFCAIDTKPREWRESDLEVLQTLAESIMREVELRRAAQQVHTRYIQMETAEQRRDEMVHMLIHDLRTPLSAISGGLQALDVLVEADETQRQMLDVSLRGARSLSQMINNILDVSRAEAGLMKLERRDISPMKLITSAMEQTNTLSQQKSLSMSVETAASLPLFRGDEGKLRRVLVNLLGNAIQYTPEAGRVCISVGVDEARHALLWCVSDSGCGIAPVELETIFQKFGQGKNLQRTHASTGLGLTFSKMVIEAHGGEIWVESEVGMGSAFYFTIPLISRAEA